MKSFSPLIFVSALLATCTVAGAEIQIGELSDIDFGQVPPTAGDLRASTTYCLTLDPRGRYQITGVGDGPGGAFSLTGSGGFGMTGLGYRVYVNDRGGGLGTEVQPNVPLSGLRGKAPRPNGRCPPPPGRITVGIDAAELRSARPGRYRGTLSLTVAPE